MVALGVKGPRAREDFFGPPPARELAAENQKNAMTEEAVRCSLLLHRKMTPVCRRRSDYLSQVTAFALVDVPQCVLTPVARSRHLGASTFRLPGSDPRAPPPNRGRTTSIGLINSAVWAACKTLTVM
jgi:hypothetical protein